MEGEINKALRPAVTAEVKRQEIFKWRSKAKKCCKGMIFDSYEYSRALLRDLYELGRMTSRMDLADGMWDEFAAKVNALDKKAGADIAEHGGVQPETGKEFDAFLMRMLFVRSVMRDDFMRFETYMNQAIKDTASLKSETDRGLSLCNEYFKLPEVKASRDEPEHKPIVKLQKKLKGFAKDLTKRRKDLESVTPQVEMMMNARLESSEELIQMAQDCGIDFSDVAVVADIDFNAFYEQMMDRDESELNGLFAFSTQVPEEYREKIKQEEAKLQEDRRQQAARKAARKAAKAAGIEDADSPIIFADAQKQ